ncbi:MAG: glycosyl transferase family 2 [Desulfuromonas sp.]|uniref:glycosyltransferase family 2 protein n=1 Tax=Desulfuromonas sp. TaxID=892 RepID=UPI000CB5D9A0|nr:glycosyltransferase family 2 protein [Desulfuromonas sp.]PLX85629.1 MAG: glycosyl transferase family 2 [Desulfuromonas sp.]
MPRTLVIIPAHNEEPLIGEVVGRVRKAVPECDILVVDDGSYDHTAAVAGRAGALVIRHPYNMGYGTTIQTGFKHARRQQYDFVVQLDGDGQHDPEFIPRLLEPVVRGETDFALGSRFLDVESYRPSFSRRLGILIFRKLVSVLIGRPITDPTSGYAAFNKDVARFFTADIFPCDYPDADMLVTLNLAGFRIQEVPVRMLANEEGKTMHGGLKPLYYIFKMFLSISVTLMRSRKFYRKVVSCR